MNPIQRLTAGIATALFLFANATHAIDSTTIDERCWNLSFDEPFNELSLWEPGKDTHENGMWRSRYIWERETIINNEEQYYLDPLIHRLSPFSISNGVLSITAQPTPPAFLEATSGQAYVSGVLTTEKSFSQKYGRFEVRAQVPKGQGLWSAFWLLPSFDRWPQGVAVLPEIDVMEFLGNQPRVYHTTLHTNQTGKLTSHPYDHTESIDLSQDFHVYSVVWTAETVQWYFNGKRRASHPTPDDFTRPVHFLLNLAVGGNWPGSPNSRTLFPASFDIDYVRAYTPSDSC